MVDVAEELGVDAIGLNHLMFSTPEEVAETVRLIGAPDASVIATFVTPDPGLDVARVRDEGRGARSRSAASATSCSTIRPKVHPPLMRQLLHAGRAARRTLPVSVPARARVVLRQGLFLPVHPRRSRRPDARTRSRRSGTASGTSRCGGGCSRTASSPSAGAAARWSCRQTPVADAQPQPAPTRRAIPLTVVR